MRFFNIVSDTDPGDGIAALILEGWGSARVVGKPALFAGNRWRYSDDL